MFKAKSTKSSGKKNKKYEKKPTIFLKKLSLSHSFLPRMNAYANLSVASVVNAIGMSLAQNHNVFCTVQLYNFRREEGRRWEMDIKVVESSKRYWVKLEFQVSLSVTCGRCKGFSANSQNPEHAFFYALYVASSFVLVLARPAWPAPRCSMIVCPGGWGPQPPIFPSSHWNL